MIVNKLQIKDFIMLHIILMLYSLCGIFSKYAAKQEFLSFKFLLLYGLVILLLGVYAILWQQILKRFPLTMAFSNKAVTVIWGMLWGTFIFQEKVKINMIIGAAIIVTGIYWMVSANE